MSYIRYDGLKIGGSTSVNDVATFHLKWAVVMKTTTFAVEVKPRELLSNVAELVLRTAHSEGLKFLRMEYLDSFEVGTRNFGRFRIDDYIGDLVDLIHKQGRSVIASKAGGYEVRIGDRKAPVPITTMHSVSRAPSMYRGPGAQHWERQFE